MEGQFDAEVVRSKLLELGYDAQEVASHTYFTIREDFGQDLHEPGSRMTNASMNRVYITDDTLITSSYTGFMTQVLERLDGTGPSLGEDPAFASLAASLKDPWSAVLMDRQTTLDPEGRGPLEYEKLPDRGTLHQWEAMGIGFDRDQAGTPRTSISLFYSDPDAAGQDELELLVRMVSYSQPVFKVEKDVALGSTFRDVCESLTPATASNEAGSTLTITCHNPATLTFWGSLFFGAVGGDLTILLP